MRGGYARFRRCARLPHLPFPGGPHSLAAEARKAGGTIDYTDTIAPVAAACVARIKAYTRCLRKHGVMFNRHVVDRETGRDI